MTGDEKASGERKWVAGPYCFEPHGGFGGKDPEGEPWPFGYISTDFPVPIFELRTILEYPREELRAAADLLAAAPVMFNALDAVRTWIETRLPDVTLAGFPLDDVDAAMMLAQRSKSP